MKHNRETFSRQELTECLRHYDLGKIHAIHEFSRGSRRSPKVIIESDKGKFLFKRRAKGKDDLTKVAFAHEIQLHLASQNFPLPHLVGTHEDNNSMLVLDSNIYEMFEYVSGEGYDGSTDATYSAGKIQGLYHKLLEDFSGQYTPPAGSYHDAQTIAQSIRNTIGSLPIDTRPPRDQLTETVTALSRSYRHCAEQANALGVNDWKQQIVHGDWHPGNMLFRDRKVVAVIDYDAARLHPRIIDLANGCLQFSIIGGSEDPLQWPAHVDRPRLEQFLRGYDAANVVTTAELKAVPYLMCEAMIAEAVLPIAATGSFGRISGFAFLQMIQRKVDWILEHIELMHSVVT
ncbi:MAG: phosphotransferase [Phycisphaerae bacterium]